MQIQSAFIFIVFYQTGAKYDLLFGFRVNIFDYTLFELFHCCLQVYMIIS